METVDIAAAIQRAGAAFQRHPAAALQDDAPAKASWQGCMRVAVTHDCGTTVLTDMPAAIGGSGDQVPPGWLLRAGLASCTATSIAMMAAVEGIELSVLEVVATSRSDKRGLFSVPDVDGGVVPSQSSNVKLQVRIAAAPGVSPERLRRLVEAGNARSPVTNALCHAVPVALHIEVAPS